MNDIGVIWSRVGAPVELPGLGGLAPLNHQADSAQGIVAHRLFSNPLEVNNTFIDQDIELVADCHLHNLHELCRKLELDSQYVAHHGIGAVLYHAYLRWGKQLAQHLSGDFAICIFDKQKQQLTIVRDRLGSKPLYYAASNQWVVVSSRIRPMLESGLIDPTMYQARLADFIVLRTESVEPERTFYQHINRLLPSHTATFTRTDLELHRYWQLTVPAQLKLSSPQAYAEAFQENLRHAVLRSIGNSSQVGSMLSGGLDSSTICALAPQLQTFSAIADEGQQFDCAETTSSASVARYLSTKHHTITPRQFVEAAGDLRLTFASSTNLFDSLMFNTSCAVMHRAHENNIKVMLDGLDGGIVAGFSGGSPLRNYLTTGSWRSAMNEVQRLAMMHGSGAMGAVWSELIRSTLTQSLPNVLIEPLRRQRRKQRYHMELLASGVNMAFANQVDMPERLAAFDHSMSGDQTLSHAQQHAKRIQHPTLMMAIERYERIARSFDIEARHPLLDIDFIEFCLSLPHALKHDGQRSKPLMRNAMQGLLPEQVRLRPYSPHEHLAHQFQQTWLNANSGFADQLSAEVQNLEPYFNADMLNIKKNQLSNNQPKNLWLIVCFMLGLYGS